MRFDLTDLQASWRAKTASLAEELAEDASAGDVVSGAARVGLLDPRADLLSQAVAAETIARATPSAAVAYAMHVTAMWALRDDDRWLEGLVRGETIGALALSTEDMPAEQDGRLTGRASWVAPMAGVGVALVGARTTGDVGAFAFPLDAEGVTVALEAAAGLRGLSCARLDLSGVEAVHVGGPVPLMARARVLMAAVGLGIGRRALNEAVRAVRGTGGAAAEEETVQGLLADAATDLDAAMLLTWQAATRDGALTLGAASAAKLAATDAAQSAVTRATQVIGVETFRQGHVIEHLAQDVRALELFAGRTETLRSAVAAETLPVPGER